MCASKCLYPSAVVLFFALFAVANSQEGRGGANEVGKTKRADIHGDPMPAGAIARLGTARWRLHERPLTFAPNGRFAVAVGEKTRLIDVATGSVVREFAAPSWSGFFTGDNRTVMLEHGEKIQHLD